MSLRAVVDIKDTQVSRAHSQTEVQRLGYSKFQTDNSND